MKGIQGTSNDTYRQLMGNGLKYIVPKFQRDYSWSAEQWDDLWQDIQLIANNEEEEHYMGYLVLQTSDNKNFTVIDGQQRLTTLSILFLTALKRFQYFVDNDNEVEKNEGRISYFRNSYVGILNAVTLISDNKLKLNRNSNYYYKSYIVPLVDSLPLRNTNSAEKSMKQCFEWYYQKMEMYNTGEELAAFLETTIADKLFFTVIKVTDEINAFKVFETLNARGVQLSSSDLLKNYLFSIIDNTAPHSNDLDELDEIWNRIIEKLVKHKFENYLRHYWNSRNKTVRKNQLFKAIRKNITSTQDAFKLVRDLEKTVDVYMAIQAPEDELWNDYPDIRKALGELQLFGIKQTNSLLLSAYNSDENLKVFTKILKICTVISFRYNIIGGLNPNEQEDVYNKIAVSISKNRSFNINDFEAVYVPNMNFENGFSTKQFKRSTKNHKVVKYIFSKIEKHHYSNEINEESDNYSIEHILPENVDDHWEGFSQEEIQKSTYKLGNLALLERKLNQQAGIQKYENKKAILRKSNCKSTALIPEEYDTWTGKKIAARQRQLAKFAKSIWCIQELDVNA